MTTRGLSEGHNVPLPLEDYLAVLRGAGFGAACIDVRADRGWCSGAGRRSAASPSGRSCGHFTTVLIVASIPTGAA